LGIIKILDESVSNMIAAGEVVENPASMVKELLENAIDAESKQIIIDIKNGGRTLSIKDDGNGMVKDDLLISIERHATSKISNKDDLFNLTSYGFRGEALSSISVVSKMIMSSRTKDDKVGSKITVLGGKITSLNDISMNKGTNIEIKELFYNTPARLKFLRKPNTEYSNIKDIVMREALINHNISIVLMIDGKVSIETSGNGLTNAIVEIFSRNTLKNIIEFSMGYLGNANLFRTNRESMFVFVNERPVKSKLIEDALIDGYYTKLMKGKFPFTIINLSIDPKEVDVNVHPSKKIVKFANDTNIYGKVLNAVKEAIVQNEEFICPSIYFENIDSNDGEDKKEEEPKEEGQEERKEKEEEKEEEKEKEQKKEIQKEERQKLENQEFTFETEHEGFIVADGDIDNKNFDFTEEILKRKYFSDFEESSNIEIKNNSPDKEILQNKIERSGTLVSDKDITSSSYVKNKGIINFKVLGQIFNTFILVERNNILEIYDQHIVNERILYESLKNQYIGKTIEKQLLLVPIRFSIDPRDKHFIFDNMNIFSDFGFDLEEWEKNDVLVRAVPTFDFRESIENVFRRILQNVKDNKEIDIRENIIISMSCRGSIKANEKLTNEEMTYIIKKLHEIGKYTCPHGRPIFIKITLEDLEKLFKRKI
jgi:DNA mismatch repair protein MutL